MVFPMSSDPCPNDPILVGQFDRDYDGCVDETSSFRFVRFWSPDQFPVFYETDAVGAPNVTDDSDFTALQTAFAAWTGLTNTTVIGGDDLSRGGPSITVAGDGKNSISFTDNTKPQLDFNTLGLTIACVAVADTVVDGRHYRPGEYIEFDIVFNSAYFNFSTPSVPGDGSFFSLESVAAHEFGHGLGAGHSSIFPSTMFYVVGKNADKLTPEEDDITLMDRAYRDPGTPPVLSVSGQILRGEDLVTPIPGAAVYAINAAGDSVQMTVSGVDGVYRFYDIAEDVRIGVHPLNGSAGVNGLYASAVNPEVAGVVQTDFVPEFWDEVLETNDDLGAPGFLIPVGTLPIANANILTNPDLVPPVVLSFSPTNGQADVAATAGVAVQFSEELDTWFLCRILPVYQCFKRCAGGHRTSQLSLSPAIS